MRLLDHLGLLSAFGEQIERLSRLSKPPSPGMTSGIGCVRETLSVSMTRPPAIRKALLAKLTNAL